MDKRIEEEMKSSLVNGKLPCAIAFQMAERYEISTKEIGDTANKLKIKISKCQLGCFP